MSLNLTGEFLLKYRNKNCTYLWMRGVECLYVGMSGEVVGRLGNHNIIGKKEPIQPDDVIHIIVCADECAAALLEQAFIEDYQPKYNTAGTHKVKHKQQLTPEEKKDYRRRYWQKWDAANVETRRGYWQKWDAANVETRRERQRRSYAAKQKVLGGNHGRTTHTTP